VIHPLSGTPLRINVGLSRLCGWMSAEALAEAFRMALREVAVEFENSQTQVTLSRDVQRLNLPGQALENLRAGAPLKVYRWAARKLVESGIAKPSEKVLNQRSILQLEWRERNNSAELQPAPEYFYLRVLEEARGNGARELLPRVKDVYSMRLNKLLGFAAKRVSPNMIENMTAEERALYEAILALVEEWFKFITAWEEEER